METSQPLLIRAGFVLILLIIFSFWTSTKHVYWFVDFIGELMGVITIFSAYIFEMVQFKKYYGTAAMSQVLEPAAVISQIWVMFSESL